MSAQVPLAARQFAFYCKLLACALDQIENHSVAHRQCARMLDRSMWMVITIYLVASAFPAVLAHVGVKYGSTAASVWARKLGEHSALKPLKNIHVY
jgi:ABC-type methionine transport system permease subunit